jgi:hypothetical protein
LEFRVVLVVLVPVLVLVLVLWCVRPARGQQPQ